MKRPFDTSFGLLRDRLFEKVRDRFNWNKLIFVRSLSSSWWACRIMSKGAQNTTRYSTPLGSLDYHITRAIICDSDGIGLLSFLLAKRTLSPPPRTEGRIEGCGKYKKNILLSIFQGGSQNYHWFRRNQTCYPEPWPKITRPQRGRTTT